MTALAEVDAAASYRNSSRRTQVLVLAACTFALLCWLLSSPLQQIYWATRAQYLEAKGRTRPEQDRLGQHLLVATPVSFHTGDSNSQEGSNIGQNSPSSDFDRVFKQARHLGFEAKIHIDRSHTNEVAVQLADSAARSSEHAANQTATGSDVDTQDQQLQLHLSPTAEQQGANSSHNLTELITLLTAHGLNLSSNPQEEFLSGIDADKPDNVSISIPLGNLSQAAAAELNLAHDTSQDTNLTNSPAGLLSPLLENSTVSTTGLASPELLQSALPRVNGTATPLNASQLANGSQAATLGLQNENNTVADAQPLPEQINTEPKGVFTNFIDTIAKHVHDAVAFSSVFNNTEQSAAQLSMPADAQNGSSTEPQSMTSHTLPATTVNSTAQQSLANDTFATGTVNSTEQQQQLGSDERDPVVDYSPGLAVVEPAEPIAADIHREEEAHKAVAPLLTQNRNESGAHKLTKELVQSLAPDNLIMVTWANYHYLDFTLNWVQHVKAAGISAYLVGAMDDDLLHELVARQVHCFGMQSGLSKDDFGWGSVQFHKMGREKIGLVRAFTSMGFDVLVSDVDTVWLRNPIPYMAAYPDAQILVASDSLHATTEDGGLELFPQAGVANIGIMLFRSGAIAFAEEWNKTLLADDKYWDQNAFNDLMNRGAKVEVPQRADRLFWAYDGSIIMGILPVATFCSGHTFFVQGMADALGLEPYVVHATFQFSGTPGKRHRMREAMLWDVDPAEYFQPPGGLLTFDMHLGDLIEQSVPYQQDANPANSPAKSMKLDDAKIGHFNLVNAQLQQVRNAMALASSLGRTLVMPQLWCGMDRWWAPHDGSIPGSSLKLPFPCPMDHIFDLEQMIRIWPEDALGPHIDWREYSLLNNSKFPAEDKAQAVQVHICQDNQAQCSNGNSPAKPDGLKIALQHGLTDRQLQTALQDVSEAAVLHFNDVRTAFGGHAEAVNASRFQHRTEIYTSLWCCVDAHPGHAWYDMWWDVIPHEDRHKRAIGKVWKPTTGP